MRRHLFLLHLRRSSTNVLIVFVAILAVIYLVERITRSRAGDGAANVSETVDLVLIGGLILAAFPVGAAAFGRAFRQQQSLFLYSLPVRRIETWAILAASAATSYLLLIATAAAARPSLIGTAFAGASSREVLPPVLLVMLLFASGTCLALAAPRQAVAIATGLVLVGPSIGLIFLINADRFRPDVGEEALFGSPVLPLGILLLTGAYLFLSALFYVRGEHELSSQILLRYAAVVGAVVLTSALVFGIVALADGREPMPVTTWHAELSPRGDHVALLEATRSMRRRRVRVFETRSGRETFRRRSSFLDAAWTSDGHLLVVDSNASLLRMILPFSVESRATFFRPDGTIAAAHELPPATEAAFISERQDDERPITDPLLIVESWDTNRGSFHVFRVAGTSLRKLGGGDGRVMTTPIVESGRRLLVAYDGGITRVFRAADRLEELRWSTRPPEVRTARHFYLLDYVVHPTEASALKALSDSYPIDETIAAAAGRKGATAGYVIATHAYSLRSLQPVRYLVSGSHGSLWEWQNGRWILLTESIEVSKRPRASPEVFQKLPETAAIAPGGKVLLLKNRGESSEIVVASAGVERTLGRVGLSGASIWSGWARRQNPTLLWIDVRTGSRSTVLIADLERNEVRARAERDAEEWDLRILADGTRISLTATVADEGRSPVRDAAAGSTTPPPPRPRAYRLVEIRPDGTRREVPLGAR